MPPKERKPKGRPRKIHPPDGKEEEKKKKKQEQKEQKTAAVNEESDISSATEATLKRSKKKREKKPRQVRPQPVPPAVLSIEQTPVLLGTPPAVKRIEDMVKDFPHLNKDTSDPKRCNGGRGSGGGDGCCNGDEHKQLVERDTTDETGGKEGKEEKDDENPSISANIEGKQLAVLFAQMPTPKLSVQIGGQPESADEIYEKLKSHHYYIDPITAEEESEQLGEAGTWTARDGRQRVYQPCAAGNNCVGMRCTSIRMRPPTVVGTGNIRSLVQIPFERPPLPPPSSSSSSSSLSSLSHRPSLSSRSNPWLVSSSSSSSPSSAPSQRSNPWALPSSPPPSSSSSKQQQQQRVDQKRERDEKKEKKDSRPPSLLPPPVTIRRVLQAFKDRDQYRHFMETGSSLDHPNYCILCYRANLSFIVLAKRGNPHNTKVKQSPQYTRSLPDNPRGYRKEYMLSKSPDFEDDVIVDCVPMWRPNLLYWVFDDVTGRWMIDQSVMMWHAPTTQAPRLGESLGDF
jgi:hypothetical protein